MASHMEGPVDLSGNRRRTARLSDIVLMLAALVMMVTYVKREWLGSPDPVSSPQLKEHYVENWESFGRAGHRMGKPDVPVVIVEWADFECPACRELAQGGLRAIRAEFPETVAVVFRHLPLPYHRLAYSTARAAECASTQGRFGAFHDAVYADQDSLGIRSLDDYAREAGVVDLDLFRDCISESDDVNVIESDIAAAHELGAGATPTILVNGIMVTGAIDSTYLHRLVREAIDRLRENG